MSTPHKPKAKRPLPPGEIAIRQLATAPHVNAWVSANAGAGKTTILRNRVIRLLLAGIAPDHILCLTFTRAAAAEMQTRIFNELARWVALEDDALYDAIRAIAGEEAQTLFAKPGALARARQLFAHAVETPGGLKLQTIHASAERLLHLFPIEAGVPVDFTVLDEGEALALKAEARQSLLEAATLMTDSATGRAFKTILAATGHHGFTEAIDAATRALTRFRNRNPGLSTAQAMGDARYEALFGASIAESEAMLDAALIASAPDAASCAAWITALRSGKTGRFSAPTLHALERYQTAEDASARHDAILKLCLTTVGKIRASLIETALVKAHPAMAEALDALKAEVETYLARRRAVRALHRSRALRLFADGVLDAYIEAKALRNALDFDDLIAKLGQLLQSGRAAWVMMKLDAAITHILVDEAQDTTPDMWGIIKALADDFFAGEGQTRALRTIFVVGDEKQSIFSFQGAEPAAFDAARAHFARAIKPLAASRPHIDQVSRPVRLMYSFRSSQDVLDAVDAVFADPSRVPGLSVAAEPTLHHSAFENFPGHVELWPIEEAGPDAQAGADDFDAPVDRVHARSPAMRSAERVARTIAGWFETGARHPSDGQRIAPGDILILVQQRNAFFNAVLRALKHRNIPVSGADRLKPKDEIVIDDLMAIARAALLCG